MDYLIVGFIVAIAIAATILSFIKTFKGESSCSCSGCSCSSKQQCCIDDSSEN